MKYFIIFLVLIGFAGYAFAIGASPPERVPASSYGIYDINGNSGEIFAVDEQIQIRADISNTQNNPQKFVYLISISDWTGRVIPWVHHGELEGTLEPQSSFSPALSWIPQKPGHYKVKIAITESDRESRLSPDIEIEFFVVGNADALDENKNCKEGMNKVFKNQFQKIACVSSETLVKLLDRNWARWHDLYISLFINNLVKGHEIDHVHSEFVKREVLKDSQVGDVLFRKNYEYLCCEVFTDDSKRKQLVISFFYDENTKYLSATYDLNEQKVIDVKIGDMSTLDKKEPKQSLISRNYWHDQKELDGLGCDKPLLEHLAKHSTLLDEEFDGTYLINAIGLPDGITQEKFDECVDAVYQSRLSLHFEKLLAENQINTPKDLVVKRASSIGGDPACGIAVDDSEKLHWFAVDSISNPSRMTVFQENPQPCQVSTSSCFCDAHVELVASTTNLTYFTLEEEQKYSDLLIDYLSEENINRTPKFLIGKLNINYIDSAIGYCGQIWGKNTYGFFSGGIINDTVINYGIDKELPLLCAISDDAKWQERK